MRARRTAPLARKAHQWSNDTMPPHAAGNAPRTSFLKDLIAQIFSDRTRIDAERCCCYNGRLGVVLLGGVLALHFSAPPDLLGGPSFALVVVGALVLLAALIVPVTRPQRVPALLALQGLVVVALTLAFALACVVWALGTPESHAFRYLPGLIGVGTTYSAALWASFGPPRARPRPWRLAGLIAGVVLELAVAALLLVKLLRS
jgi:hypothetical protein